MGRNAIAIMVSRFRVRVAAFHASKRCDSGHHPSDISCTGALGRSLSHESFAVGTLTCGHGAKVVSCFNKLSSVGRVAVHYIKDPSGHFDRSTLEVVHTVQFTSILSVAVSRRARVSVRGGHRLLGGVSTRQVTSRFGGLVLKSCIRGVLSRCGSIVKIFVPRVLPTFNFSRQGFRRVCSI